MVPEQIYPIDHEDRKATVAALMEIITSDDRPVALRAVRLVLRMEELNLRYEAEEARRLDSEVAKLLASKRGNQ